MIAVESKFLTVEAWMSNPSVFHGFGMRSMTEQDLRDRVRGKGATPVCLQQIHSDIIHCLSGVPAGELRGDALLTDRPGLLLCVRTADCLPLLILSQDPGAVGAVHCGWKGTSLGLAGRAVRTMVSTYGCDPNSLQAALGPSIAVDCFEVGEDVRRSFSGAGSASPFFTPLQDRPGQYLFDLREANRRQLLSCGLRKENIHTVSGCTKCDEKFYSHRRAPYDAGRMLNFVCLLF